MNFLWTLLYACRHQLCVLYFIATERSLATRWLPVPGVGPCLTSCRTHRQLTKDNGLIALSPRSRTCVLPVVCVWECACVCLSNTQAPAHVDIQDCRNRKRWCGRGFGGFSTRDSYSLKETLPLPAMDVQSDLTPLENKPIISQGRTLRTSGPEKLPSPLSLSFSLLLCLFRPISLVLALSN